MMEETLKELQKEMQDVTAQKILFDTEMATLIHKSHVLAQKIYFTKKALMEEKINILKEEEKELDKQIAEIAKELIERKKEVKQHLIELDWKYDALCGSR